MIDLLKKYIKTIEIGNMTTAAKELKISQPALSQIIQKLEQEFNCKLIVRGKKGLTPNSMGKLVYESAKNLTFLFSNLQEKINEELNIQNKQVNIGMIDNLGLFLNKKICQSLVNNISQNEITVLIDNTDALLAKLDQDQLDFAIISYPQQPLPNKFIIEDFQAERLILVASPELYKKIKLKKDLEKLNFITYKRDSNTFKMIEKEFKKQKIKINPKIYSSSPHFILEIILLGGGIGVLPENIVKQELTKKKLLEINKFNLKFTRKFALIYKRTKYISKSSRQLIEEFKAQI